MEGLKKPLTPLADVHAFRVAKIDQKRPKIQAEVQTCVQRHSLQ